VYHIFYIGSRHLLIGINGNLLKYLNTSNKLYQILYAKIFKLTRMGNNKRVLDHRFTYGVQIKKK